MSAYIINAAPMSLPQGTQDLSTTQLPRAEVAIPQHLPKAYIYAKKGPTTPQLVVGNELEKMYGAETFSEIGKFCNHSTIFVNKINAQGNAQMIERVVPTDAGPAANTIFWLDVLPCKVNDYERNTDGSIKTDSSGNPVIIGQIDGFKVKWVVSNHNTVDDQAEFGQLVHKAGDQINSADGSQSVRYPIFEKQVASQGAWGNDVGTRFWAPNVDTVLNMPTELMAKERVYPYYTATISRKNAVSTPKIVETLFGDQSVMFTLKPGTIDPTTEAQVYMGDVALAAYQNLTDLKYPVVFGDFGSLAIYQDNIDELLAMFHAAEVPFIDSFSDFTSASEDIYLFNIISGVSSNNVPYHSFQFVDDVESVILTEYTNIFAKGGSDGTMSDAAFANLVSERVLQYAEPSNVLQDLAINVESIIYDTGFPLQTKKDLCSFIAVRKDTFVVLSTHISGEETLNAEQEYSRAIALRTRLQMYPESDYFGTPVMRGMIVGRSAKLLNSNYKKRLPLSLEVAIKSAKYMGAGTGRWKNGKNFDRGGTAVIDSMYDISITWTPPIVRNKNWDVGLNFVISYDTKSYTFPALKTVYDDDTSVLNSFFTALAIGQINKITEAAWREFTGDSTLTNSQLVDAVNAFITARCAGRFDNRFKIEPAAYFTDMDLKRGFSWTVPVKIYANNMRSVMTSYIQAYRMSDYSGK